VRVVVPDRRLLGHGCDSVLVVLKVLCWLGAEGWRS
jgi:hypothetical protein